MITEKKRKDRFWRIYATAIGGAVLLIAALFGSLFITKSVGQTDGQILGIHEQAIQEFPFVELPKIYGDGLALGWENWSWESVVNFSSFATSTSERGKSIEVFYQAPNSGFLISAPHFDTSKYNSIKISVYIPKDKSTDHDLFLEFGDVKGKSVGMQLLNWYIEGKSFKPDTWYDIVVPLSNLNAAGAKIGSISVVSSNPATVYLDNIEFSSDYVFFPAWVSTFNLDAQKKKAPSVALPYTSDFFYKKDDWQVNSGEIDIPYTKMRLFVGTSTNYGSYSLKGGDLWSDYRYTVYLDWGVGDSINIIGRYSEDGGFYSCSFYDDGANVTLNQSQNGKIIELDSPLNYTKNRIYSWPTTKSLGIEMKGDQVSCLRDGEVKVSHVGRPLSPLFGTAAIELWSKDKGQSAVMINKVVVEAI